MVINFEPLPIFRNYSKYWHHLWDYRYGNCYTFNGGIDDNGDNQRVLSSHVTGPTGGNSCFELLLSLDCWETHVFFVCLLV